MIVRRCVAAALVATLLLPAGPLPRGVPGHAGHGHALAQMKSDLPRLGSAGGDDLSPFAERRLGEQIMRDLRRDRVYEDDAEMNEFLNAFGAGLLADRGSIGQDIEFFLVKEPSINAFALPGGFIGIHTGLMVASQTESQLAGVMAHEVGHVSQRHIARMLGEEKQASMLVLAGMVLAALAARSSPDAAFGLATLGQSAAMRQMLGFSRDAEREADRIGLDLLGNAGFDPNGMVEFFGRLRSANMLRETNAPAYIRTHPMDGERMADMQNRLRDLRYRQRPDGLSYRIARAKARVMQDVSQEGLRASRTFFEQQGRASGQSVDPALIYGQALVAHSLRDGEQAERLLTDFRRRVPGSHPFVDRLSVELRLARRDVPGAQTAIAEARARFPNARALRHMQAAVLSAGGDSRAAVAFLTDQVGLDRGDPTLWRMLAEAHSAAGEQAQAHRAAAEQFVLVGAMPAAIEQLQLAQRASRGDFQAQAVIDARLRELREEFAREQRERGGRRGP